MKLPKWIIWLIFVIVVIAGSYYTVVSLRRAAAPPEPAKTPSLDNAPVRLYGRVEPLHREVFLGPLQPRRVTKILVKEGMEVHPGQVLVELDSDVEQQAAQLARLRVLELESQLDRLLDELRREVPLTEIRPGEMQNALQVLVLRVRELESRLDLVLDELKRKEPLSQIGAVSEQDFSQKILEAKSIRSQIATATAEAELDFQQKQLQAESIRRQIATAKAEVELKRRELDKLTLVSPIEGMVYKLDVRIGELLTAQDYARIVLGERRKQIRMYVESYWFGKIRQGDRFQIRDGETLERIGEGTVTEVSQYVGVRDFRTEDSMERLDTKYAQAILSVDNSTDIPLGKLVLCDRTLSGQ
ncbi:MAG: biotin/lipoyl-binding protein [Acidobacteria bacterium]|nr:biotin/lipoyl-binding protein [Acidobacteriota bacterium]